MRHSVIFLFFFFNDTATTEIYTLSLHDALPIFSASASFWEWFNAYSGSPAIPGTFRQSFLTTVEDRKSTRLNSSHSQISYAVFCLKKKKTKHHRRSVARYNQ